MPPTLCKKDLCTGCMACYSVCPKQAISIQPDDEGFNYPAINEQLCIDCGMCEKTCPELSSAHQASTREKTECFAAWSLNNGIRSTSSSGGCFASIASYVINDLKGIVYGAAYDSYHRVHHIGIDNVHDLSLLLGSKYVQSDINTAYLKIKENIRLKRYVLFCGTPCQIAGLIAFLKTSSKYLYTIDLVCHGVPSPELFSSYIEYLHKRFRITTNLTGFTFRLTRGWTLQTSFITNNGHRKVVIGKDNFYLQAYLKGFLHRKSCYTCPYANLKRNGDITLGDFWGVNLPETETRNGVSLILVNTNRGKDLFEKLKTSLFVIEKPISEAVIHNSNLIQPHEMPDERKYIYQDYKSMTFKKFLRKYQLQNSRFHNFLRAYNYIRRNILP